jgi:hypothetical protein
MIGDDPRTAVDHVVGDAAILTALGESDAEVSSSRHLTYATRRQATAPSATPDDEELARLSSHFPVMAKPPTVRRASVPQATGLPLANRKTTLERSPCISPGMPLTAAQPHLDSVFVPCSAQQSAPKS